MADDASDFKEIPPEDRKKAETFFAQGRKVAQAGQYDYAIEMYLSGIAKDPEAVAEHQALREIALKRKVNGGKDLGMMAKMKFRYGKDDVANIVIAERFLAYDPGNRDRMLELLNHAAAAGCRDLLMWIGPMLLRANIDSGKPEISKFMALKSAYVRLKRWPQAVEAAQHALRMRPADMDLQTEVKHLAAQQTLDAGGYGNDKSFTDNVRDATGQQNLMNQDKDIRTVDALTAQILGLRAELAKEPGDPSRITKLVDVLIKTEQSDYENEAIEVLDGAFKRTNQFRFRMRVGQIKIQQLRRMERSLREEVQKNPTDEEAKKTYRLFLKDRNEEEYKEFALAADNYPTDLVLKYEMARRLIAMDQYAEAIPLLQQAVQDAKLRVDGSIELGKAFMAAEFYDEAIDTMKNLADSYQQTGDTRYKEINYQFGRALEARGDATDAIKCYSKVAQSDFNYKDVQVRLKDLRKKPAQ